MKGLILFSALLLSLPGFAQKSDTEFISTSISHAQDLYNTVMKGEWPLNSGGQYVEYVSIQGEHPFFIPDWTNGTVQYLDDVYFDVPLLLDLRSNKLITLHTLYDIKIELSPEKVKSFTMAGHRFVSLHTDSIKTLPESGYYDVLQSGNVSVVALRKKFIKYTVASAKQVASLTEIKRYYLLKDGAAVPVKSKKSMLKALSDRPDLKTQLRKNKISFGQNREAGLAAIVRIYNELKKAQ